MGAAAAFDAREGLWRPAYRRLPVLLQRRRRLWR